MRSKRVIGIVVGVVGIAMIFTAHCIRQQTDEGSVKVTRAQQKMDAANEALAKDKNAKQSRGATSSIQRNINEAKVQIQEYGSLATWLQVGGIIFVLGGVGTLFLTRKKKPS